MKNRWTSVVSKFVEFFLPVVRSDFSLLHISPKLLLKVVGNDVTKCDAAQMTFDLLITNDGVDSASRQATVVVITEISLWFCVEVEWKTLGLPKDIATSRVQTPLSVFS